jgi:hypothetical protein
MVGTGYPVFAQSQPLAIGIRAAIVAELGCDEHAAAMRAVRRRWRRRFAAAAPTATPI